MTEHTPEKILVCVAWPYASGPRHLGHVAGAYLPPDIFARYHRMKGNRVLMVSGSDMNGTPITVAAEREGVTPETLALRMHRLNTDLWHRMGFTYDLFTDTTTPIHRKLVQDFFLTLYEKGYIFKDTTEAMYCDVDKRFLPDRYVEGECPHCHYLNARGDQCDNCGRQLDPIDLINIRCKLCGTKPYPRPTEHFFLDLPKIEERLLNWLNTGKEHWRPNVVQFTVNWIREGLRPRAYTRDLEWGVPIPIEGYEHSGKRIYVWFDAVKGYLSATMEWARLKGDPDAWKEWWLQEEGEPLPSKSYYFIGKDNISFHTIIWPSMLIGHGGLTLPYDVPANEFLTGESGEKASSSRGGGGVPWLPDYLDHYKPDPIRYFMTSNAPETRDTVFSWAEFYRRNNDELVATYGNLVHRVLTFTYRNFDGKVPQPGELTDQDRTLIANATAAFERVGDLIAACRFKEALREVMSLASEANRYLDDTAPWKAIKVGRERAGTSLYVTLTVINALKLLTAPFIPFSAQQLHEMLGFHGDVHAERWAMPGLPATQALGTPTPLFDKLDEANLEEENARLGNPWVDPEGPIAQQGPQERVVIFENGIRTRKDLGEEWA
ncbi:MAG: methionyl-tRNA synthetase [Chloroflexia bacterium]|nr:methionyl-tRNA synthetase [Chloroflexia bacterium]